MSLAEFYVVGYRQRFELEELTSGNYSRLCADILFSRSMGYYIIQVGHVPPRVTVTCPRHAGVRAQQPDRGDVLGELLPGPQLGPRQGGAGGDHRAHHGHPHGLRQQVRQQTIHVNMS